VDRDANVQKWMKPSKGQFQIDYRSGQAYEPDFVVEARSGTFICEVKSEVEMKDPVVQAKANAARKWCKAAAAHAAKNGGKPWSYALIPDGQIMTNATLDGLMAKFVVASQIDI
jgi:type III restriction enzyme